MQMFHVTSLRHSHTGSVTRILFLSKCFFYGEFSPIKIFNYHVHNIENWRHSNVESTRINLDSMSDVVCSVFMQVYLSAFFEFVYKKAIKSVY